MNFAAGNHVLILIRPTSTQKNNYFNLYLVCILDFLRAEKEETKDRNQNH